MSLHILHTPCELVSQTEHGEVRWCFLCRKRVKFVLQVWRPVDKMSYYGPHASVHCQPQGHLDGDLFPGRYREGEG